MSEHTGLGFRRTWIDHSLDVEASIADVSALLHDIDNWPSWTPGLTEVRRSKRNGGPRPGGKFTMLIKPASFHPPLPVPCEIFTFEPNLLVWGGGIPGSKVRHSFELTELGPTRTRVRQIEYATNVIALVTLIAEPGIHKHNLRWSKALQKHFAPQ